MKYVLIVLDSVGIGEAPDAANYGDAGAYTLQHIAEHCGKLNIPTLASMGLGNIPSVIPNGKTIPHVAAVESPIASYGAMQEVSEGKDTITGHWEMAGLEIIPGFHLFPAGPPSFPADLIDTFEKETGRKCIGDKAASGTAIIQELGEEATRDAKWIVYTSADSVFQIAANVDVIPLEELYKACEIAQKLCDPLKVGRVIARPFTKQDDTFVRTEDRRDYAYNSDEKTVLEMCAEKGISVCGVGKIEDIFANKGITYSNHTNNTEDSQQEVSKLTISRQDSLIFANFIDFDMLYGHRRDPEGYANALEQTDQWLAEYLPLLTEDDVLVLAADHGNDPTFKGTDHTREYVPLLVYQPGKPGQDLGVRKGFYDIAQSIATFFNLEPASNGVSFL